MKTSIGQRNALQILPLELQLCILNLLPDVDSLACAALSCRHFYTLFRQNEEKLLKNVLINCIGLNVLPEAVKAYPCSPPYLNTNIETALDLGAEEAQEQGHYAIDFIQQLPLREEPIWPSMHDSLIISRLHVNVVSCLTDKFIHACSKTTHVPLGASLEIRPASQTEKDRISRVLYRFEIFRKLLGCFSNEYELHLSFLFFSRFAPWKNEQLQCIHDFLAQEVMIGE
jgi:hypothetical protein